DVLAGRLVEVDPADHERGLVRQAGEHRLGRCQIRRRHAGDGPDHGAAVEVEGGEQVAAVGDVDAVERDLGVAGPLVREVVEDRAADLEVAARGDGVEVVDLGPHGDRTAAALDLEGDG